MRFPGIFRTLSRRLASHPTPPRVQLKIESLESRLVPYSISGNAWPHPELVTLSFMPDGTDLGGVTSNLFGAMNARWAHSVWQHEILRAAQVWAEVTNLNFALVNDSGAPSGSGTYQQGDANFGDTRIGAYDFGSSNLGSAMMPPPANNYSLAGDFTLNSAPNWVIDQTGGYDLFTAAAHELGHSLGLYHSHDSAAGEYSFYNGIKPDLNSDDIAAVRAIYSDGLGRSPDAYDALLGNETFLTATDLTTKIDPVSLTAQEPDLDLTTRADLDYYSFLAPLNTSSTLTVTVQSSGLSMLMPTVTVYNALQQEIGYASGAGQYGATLSVTIDGVLPEQLFYVKVAGAKASAFGTGRYALTLNFGTGPSPLAVLPSTVTLNGSPLRGGGGLAAPVGSETRINTTTAGSQTTSSDMPNRNAVAMNGQGNHVVTWTSQGQDGSGDGVFARMFGPDGVATSAEFQVNTYTAGDQLHATAALDDAGGFVIAWASQGQDPDGSWGTYAQRFDAAGRPLGGEFAVANGAREQKYPTLAMAADGQFVIAWADAAADGNGWGVAAQRYDAAGQAQGDTFVVNTTRDGDQTQAALALGRHGTFVVVWTHASGAGDTSSLAKVYDGTGAVVQDEFPVNLDTAGFQDHPAVSLADDGDFVVTWSDYSPAGAGWDIQARRFTFDGQARGSAFRVNSSTSGDQWYSSVAVMANGEAVIAWKSFDGAGNELGIFAQQYTAAGTPVGPETGVNTTQGGSRSHPSLTANDLDGFAIGWSGEGVDDVDGIFIQHYQTDGGGGVAGAADDFLGIGEHGTGCGCALCQTAAGASGQVSFSVGEQTGAEQVAPLLQGLATQTAPAVADSPASTAARLAESASHEPGTVPVPAAESPTASPSPREVALPKPDVSATQDGDARLSGQDQAAPPEMVPVPAESSREVPDADTSWIQALDLYFMEETARPFTPDSSESTSSESEAVSPDAGTTPLAGLSLVLGGLWAMRPEQLRARRQPRREDLLYQ